MTTPTNVSQLRQRMIEDMIARRMVPGTQVGHIRAYSAAAAIYAAGILGMALAFEPVAWGLLRFLQGAGSAVMFTAAESWIADSTPRSKRGGVMGIDPLPLVGEVEACPVG